MTAQELDDFIKRHNLKQKELAEILGVTYQAIGHWVCGRRKIPEMLSRLIAMFDNDHEDMAYFKGFASKEWNDEDLQ